MKTETNLEKGKRIALAWEELILAIKPDRSPSVANPKAVKKAPEKKALHHPAVITTPELSNWEVFC